MTEKADPHVLWSWMIPALTTAVPLTALLAMVVPYLPFVWQPLVWIGWGIVWVLFGCVYLPLRRRALRYALTEDGIEVISGVLILTTRCIRRDAVRQVTILQGPVERRYGTAVLLVSGTGGYLLVEGLPLAKAEDWCRRMYPQ